MKHEKFLPSEEVLADNLNSASELTNFSVTERHRDYYTSGIVKNPGSIINNGVPIGINESFIISVNGVSNTRIDVGWGIAYADNGKRSIIYSNVNFDEDPAFANSINKKDNEGNSIPNSTGNIGVKLLPAVLEQYVWIDYLEIVDPEEYFADPDTGKRKYTKWLDGYAILVTATGDAPSQTSTFLCKVKINTTTGEVESINITGRKHSRTRGEMADVELPDVDSSGIPVESETTQNYPGGATVSVQDHAAAMGTGVLSKDNPHAIGVDDIAGLRDLIITGEPENIVYQRETTENGLLGGTTGLVAKIVLNPLGVVIRPLYAQEVLYVYGYRYNSQTAVTPLLETLVHPYGFWFVDFSEETIAGAYGIFLSRDISTGTLRLKAEKIILPYSSDEKYQLGTVYFQPSGQYLYQDSGYSHIIPPPPPYVNDDVEDNRVFGIIGTEEIQDGAVTDAKIVTVSPQKIAPQGTGSTLDSDLLDGMHAGNTSGSIPINNGILNDELNAEYLNGTTKEELKRLPYNYTLMSEQILNFPGVQKHTKLPDLIMIAKVFG